MPFPFYWIGAATALLFLGGSMVLFGIAVKLLSITSTGVRDSVLPGLVSGFRDWTEQTAARVRTSSPRAADGSPPLHESAAPLSRLERVRPRIR